MKKWVRKLLVMFSPSKNAVVFVRDHCSRCGKKLKSAESIAEGIGPTCKRKRAAEWPSLSNVGDE